MKKISQLLVLFLFFACTPTDEVNTKPAVTLEDTDVRFEFTTTEQNYDEIEFSYYVNGEDKFTSETLVFEYDNNGNPLTKIIEWKDFGYKYIRGEAYRNNFSEAELSIKIYVNDELVYEESETGNPNAYARVVFDYTIE